MPSKVCSGVRTYSWQACMSSNCSKVTFGSACALLNPARVRPNMGSTGFIDGYLLCSHGVCVGNWMFGVTVWVCDSLILEGIALVLETVLNVEGIVDDCRNVSS